MPKKKTKKNSYQPNRRIKSKNLLLFFVVVISFLSIFLTINQVQKRQTIKHEAATETSQITQPVWGCLGLGSQDICKAKGTFVSDEANNVGCIGIESAAVTPANVEQGQTVVGKVVIRNMCFAGQHIPQLFIKAVHSSGKVIEFATKSTPQTIIKDQALTFTSEYQLAPDELPGEWHATLFTRGTNNSEIPFAAQTNDMKFTVAQPCAGLTVSQALTLDKGQVNVGESINGSITYRNPCTSTYTVNDMLIQVKRPGTGNSTTIDDFMPGLGKITIGPQQEKVVSGTLTIPPDPCGGQPTCQWSAFGAYQKTTNGWVLDPKVVTFTVGQTASNQNPAPTGAPNPTTAKLAMKTVFFEFSSLAIQPAYRATLDTVVQFMKANPTANVTLEGHTDNVDTQAYNLKLSRDRAEAVRTYLVGKGIAANRFTIIAKGETEPLASNNTAAGRAKNRRVEIFTP